MSLSTQNISDSAQTNMNFVDIESRPVGPLSPDYRWSVIFRFVLGHQVCSSPAGCFALTDIVHQQARAGGKFVAPGAWVLVLDQAVVSFLHPRSYPRTLLTSVSLLMYVMHSTIR